MSKTAMPVPEASRKTKVTLSPDESYDRYKRPSLRWQPILLVCAAATLLLAWLKNEDLYRPDHLFISMIPTSMLSLDQRVDRIMSLTPLIGQFHSTPQGMPHLLSLISIRIRLSPAPQTVTTTLQKRCTRIFKTTSIRASSSLLLRTVACQTT